MKQNYYFSKRGPRLRAWLMMLFMLTIGTGMTWAAEDEYVTLNGGTGYTYSFLVGRCGDRHVKVEGSGSVRLNISGNLNIKELYAPEADVEIVLSNNAKLRVELEANVNKYAMEVHGLKISGYGHVDIIGGSGDAALGLKGGQFLVENPTNTYTGVLIMSNKYHAISGTANSTIVFDNSDVTLRAAGSAVDDMHGVCPSMTVRGDRGSVHIRGSLGSSYMHYEDGELVLVRTKIPNLNIEGGNVVVTANKNDPAIVATNLNITGGTVLVNRTGNQAGLPKYDETGILAETAFITNCTLEINSEGDYGLYVTNNLTINNANVRAYVPYGEVGILSEGNAKLLGNDENSIVRTQGKKVGIAAWSFMEIANHTLFAFGNEYGVSAPKISITPQSGCSYEAFAEDPFHARYNLTNGSGGSITFNKPVSMIGSYSSSSTNSLFMGGSVQEYAVGTSSHEICLVSNAGTRYRGYVKLQQPHIYNVTGRNTNNDFDLLGSGVNRYSNPGKTETFDFSPLEPYLTYDNPVKTIKLYKKQYTSGGSGEKTLVQQWNNTTVSSVDWTFTEADVPFMYWCDVSLDAYEGTLSSYRYLVSKGSNSAQPVTPIVTLNNNTLRVSNGRSDQEYIVIADSQWSTFVSDMNSPGGPLGSWWENSAKPVLNAAVLLNGMGTQGQVNHVVTRFKETAGYKAGYRYASAAIFFGSSVELQSAVFAFTAIGDNYVRADFDDTYTTLLNGVIKLEVKPIPANATNYYGVRGDSWSGTYMTSGEQPFLFYADQACTTPLDNDTYYTSVYVKANREGYKWTLIANAYNGDPEGGVPATTAEMNIIDPNAPLRPYKLIVNRGESITTHSTALTGIPFEVIPSNASLDGDVKVALGSVTGSFANVARQADRIPTFTVDKANRTISLTPNTKPMLQAHTYRFIVSHVVNGTTYGTGALRVEVVDAPLNSLNITPAQATLMLGESLPLEITSDLPDAWRGDSYEMTCVSSDESVATVKWDWFNNRQTWFVTATDDPEKMGQSATITLTVNGIEATCEVKVDGEIYPITIQGTQVNSVNSDDVLGDGKVRYVAGTLYLNGAQVTTTTQDALRFTASDRLPVLNLDVEGENRLQSSRVGISLQGDAVVSGSGTLIGSGDSYGLLGSSANLTITGDAVVHTTGGSTGMRVGSLNVVGENAQVKTMGEGYSSLIVVSKELWGNITEPAGAYLNDDGYVTLDGNIVYNRYVVINGVAGEKPLEGDVNGDGVVSGADVTALYGLLLEGKAVAGTADVNGDGSVSGADVTALYNILLN